MRRLTRLLLVLLALLVGIGLLLTGASPWVEDQPIPSPTEIQDVREILGAASRGGATDAPIELALDRTQLQSLAALASRGFAPNRFDAMAEDDKLTVTVSRPFWFRWINVRAEMSGESEGFPNARLKIGSLQLSEGLSRSLIEIGRRHLADRGLAVEPLDKLVQSSRIEDGKVRFAIRLPDPSALQQAFSDNPLNIDPEAVALAYCQLVERQRESESDLLSQQLGRAMAASGETREQHAAALVALSMLVVDPQSGRLAGVAPAKIKECKLSAQQITLMGRRDWAMHWSLSAALAVTSSGQFANAIGEWKELADSRPKNPSGFSFADLAADRSGQFAARRLTDPALLGEARRWAMQVDEDQLLPDALIDLGDGISDAEFEREFGGTDTSRYHEQISEIDQRLRQSWSD